MFNSARLQLTAWYLLIIMIISILFSYALYDIACHEIQNIIQAQNERLHHFQMQPNEGHHNFPPPLITEDDEDMAQHNLLTTLILVNVGILLFSGGAAYFLAGRTLRPIKLMIDEQNHFISSASHELRTPIATMRAEMEGSLLEKRLSDSTARKLIKSNLEELHELQTLSNTLLQLAHIHNGGLERFIEKVALQDVIKSAEKKILALAKQKNISITMQINPSTIQGDKNSLKEVFVILLDNAIKYSPEKSTIVIKTEITKNMAVVSIQDEGMGIAMHDLPHIFDRFYRADTSRSEVQGYGLGLSIARKVITLHNGAISVTSEEGKGTIFTVQLPIVYS